MSLGDDDPTPVEGKGAELEKEALKEMLEVCPDLGGEQATAIMMECAKRAADVLNKIEARVLEAGSISSETAVRIMLQGAVAKVLADMPEGSDRRKLYEAGVRVGTYLTKKWQRRIQRELSAREGGN